VDRTDERLTALEIKTSFQDEMIDKLDQVIIRQQEQIDALTRELVHLRNQPADVGSGALRNAHDDLPPHY
jgi:SlyX protein